MSRWPIPSNQRKTEEIEGKEQLSGERSAQPEVTSLVIVDLQSMLWNCPGMLQHAPAALKHIDRPSACHCDCPGGNSPAEEDKPLLVPKGTSLNPTTQSGRQQSHADKLILLCSHFKRAEQKRSSGCVTETTHEDCGKCYHVPGTRT